MTAVEPHALPIDHPDRPANRAERLADDDPTNLAAACRALVALADDPFVCGPGPRTREAIERVRRALDTPAGAADPDAWPPALRDLIPGLVAGELGRACAKFPPMHSAHEGSSTLREELEELDDEVVPLRDMFDRLWSAVKCDNVTMQRAAIERMGPLSLAAVLEAVQVAAMVQRYRQDVLGLPADGEGRPC